jgi:5-methyltetrahydropteroyltriglutamate--homocysteine methyltransferase
MPILAQSLGYPRLGRKSELNEALVGFRKNPTHRITLLSAAARIRRDNWLKQRAAGIDLVPSNDFSLVDHVLDQACLLGCVPEACREPDGSVSMSSYFALAGGGTVVREKGFSLVAEKIESLETKEYFGSGYGYRVPKLSRRQDFQLGSSKPFNEFEEAMRLGIRTKPVLLGPVSFLRLCKCEAAFDPLSLLDRLLPVYEILLRRLSELGAHWVQMDEPALSSELDIGELSAFAKSYQSLAKAAPGLSLLISSDFGCALPNIYSLLEFPIQALHLDVFLLEQELRSILRACPKTLSLSLGVVDGRRDAPNDYRRSLGWIGKATAWLGADRVLVAPTCSLLHCPGGTRQAQGKLDQVATLARLGMDADAPQDGAYLENQRRFEKVERSEDDPKRLRNFTEA